MKTSYKILWVDDDKSSTDTDQADVEELFEDYGIEAKIQFVEAPGDGSVKGEIGGYLDQDDLDLLMVDYHMHGLSGDKLVNMIRETDHIYLPVIFYSSSSPEEIFDAARKAELDGVYIANRGYLINKVELVVKSLLKKEHTSKSSRGLLMEGVSEIDASFDKVYRLGWSVLPEGERKKVFEHLANIVGERKKRAEKVERDFPSDLISFAEHMEKKFLSPSYDTFTRWRVVKNMLSYVASVDEQIDILIEFGKASGSGDVCLNDLRNKYAHLTRDRLEDIHSEERCVAIRRALRSQTSNIDALVDKLSAANES